MRPGDRSTIRQVFTWGLVFVGAWVTFFGIGYLRVPVILSGVAIMLLAGAGKLVAKVRGVARQWVPGTGQVLEVSPKPENVPYGRCQMVLAIDAPGLPRDAVTLREPRVPVPLWPAVGELLPIEVAADDIRRVRILWPEPEEGADDKEAPVDEETGADDDGWDEGDPLFRRGADRAPEPAARAELAPDDDEIDFALDGPPTVDLPVVPSPATGARVPRQPGRRPYPYARAAEAVATVPAHDPAAAPDAPQPGGGPAAAADPMPDPATEADRVADDDRADDDAPAPDDMPAPDGGPADGAPPSDRDAADGGDPDRTVMLPRAGPVRQVGLTLLVRDLAASRRFYLELLGFVEIDRTETETVLTAGDTILVLRQSRQLDRIRHRVVHLHVEVDDVGTAYERLRQAGVRFTSPPRVVTRGGRMEQWAAAFQDPDGHGVAITRWRHR